MDNNGFSPDQKRADQNGIPMQHVGHPQAPPGTVMTGQPTGAPMYSGHMGQGLPHVAPAMAAPANCPPGLEYLTMIDQLLVKQKMEVFEMLTGFETNNKYTVMNTMGQQVYAAVEDNDCCNRQFCGPMRSFDIKIFDNSGHEVIHLNRPLRCQSCCCPCCLQELEVTAPPGSPVGYVVQEWSFWTPRFLIQNAQRETILRIEGPCCTISCCNDVEFQVLSADGKTQVGKISKQWTGLLKESYTDADNFGIQFPMDLDVQAKATMLGALFLIDFMFFEHQQEGLLTS